MSMAGKNSEPESVQFTITLPRDTAMLLEKLAKTPFYANTRAAVAAEIIRDHLKDLWKSGRLPD
jgi:hypothetical protein